MNNYIIYNTDNILKENEILDYFKNSVKDKEALIINNKKWSICCEKTAKIAIVVSNWPQNENIKNLITSKVSKKYPHII